MDYVTRYFFAQQRFFLEQAAFLISYLKEGNALNASFEKLLKTFDYNQAMMLSMLNTYVDSHNSSASQQ